MKRVKVVLIGIGNAGKPLCRLLVEQRQRLEDQCGVSFDLVGVSDSQGSAVAPQGIDPLQVLSIKETKRSVSELPEIGRPGMSGFEMIRASGAQMLVECSPASLPEGQPALDHIRTALSCGMDVVTANKAPLAVAWGELFAQAKACGKSIRYGCAASSGMPTLEMGRFLGQTDELVEMSGIFNATCQFIFEQMLDGKSFEKAVEGARVGGFLEADPTKDLDGWDVAMKTVIQANTYFGTQVTLQSVCRTGIQGITREQLQQAEAQGERWMMVGRAWQEGGKLKLSAGPERLSKDHPLARARWCDKALYLKTKTQGEQIHYCVGASASSTPGSVLDDMVAIARNL
ncbi:MAG: hypothetical protein ACOX7N_08605 [Lawsonibacter sp.]